jgi:hypothetical protein
MSRSALAIRHVAFEDFGILAPLPTARGYSIRKFGFSSWNVPPEE